jgi:hypothetical protein
VGKSPISSIALIHMKLHNILYIKMPKTPVNYSDRTCLVKGVVDSEELVSKIFAQIDFVLKFYFIMFHLQLLLLLSSTSLDTHYSKLLPNNKHLINTKCQIIWQEILSSADLN